MSKPRPVFIEPYGRTCRPNLQIETFATPEGVRAAFSGSLIAFYANHVEPEEFRYHASKKGELGILTDKDHTFVIRAIDLASVKRLDARTMR